jgi:carboxypeptidase PM20D1
MPPDDSAAERLSQAILAIRGDPFPGGFDHGPAGEMLETMAPQLGFVARAAIANRWLFEPLLVSRTGATPAGNALLRTTLAPTMLLAGTKPNVLPQEAQAYLNLRLHPRDSVAGALAHLRHSVAGIEGVTVETSGRFSEPSPVSSSSGEAYELLAALAGAHSPPGAPVVPALVLAATDSRFYATIATNVYRFAPAWMPQAELQRIHGTGERLALADLERMIDFYAQLMSTAAR